MKLIAKRAWILLILCFLFIVGIVFFVSEYINKAPTWVTYPANKHLFDNGKMMGTGDITDRNGAILASTVDGKRTFSYDYYTRLSTLHLVGDGQGNIANSLESTYADTLLGWNFIMGTYSFDKESNGNNIKTNIDANVNRTAQLALEDRKGTIGVMNYKTGEIICMVSNPTADPYEIGSIDLDSDQYEGLYINRLLSASYVPGSIFKIVTAAAAIDNIEDINTRIFECNGSKNFGGGKVSCLNNTAHGSQTFQEAMTNSCNVTFATLATELGKGTMKKYAKIANLGQERHLDRIKLAKGYFNVNKATAIDLAWAGCGQSTDQINPMSYLSFIATIANQGKAVNPKIINSIESPLGLPVWFKPDLTSQGEDLDPSTALQLKEMMRNNVLNSYGEGELAGHGLSAKSGTAEVGGDLPPHSLFTGFLDDPQNPYAFIVIIENGGTGSTYAGSAAREVMAAAIN